MEAGENYLGVLCVFASSGAFLGALVTAIAVTLWQDETRNRGK